MKGGPAAGAEAAIRTRGMGCGSEDLSFPVRRISCGEEQSANAVDEADSDGDETG